MNVELLEVPFCFVEVMEGGYIWSLLCLFHILWQVKSQKMDLERSKKDYTNAIKEYAIRFLKYNDSDVSKNQAEVPLTPDRISDWGNMDASLEDHLTEVCVYM